MNARWIRFVDEYLIDLNGTQAAIRAGFAAKGAHVTAVRLLSNPKLQGLIQAKMAARAERVGMSQDQVLAEVKLLSRSSISDYIVDKDGRLAPAPGCSPDVMRAVSSVRYTRKPDGTTEVLFKLWDKPGSLRLSSQHLGMVTEKHEHSGEVGVKVNVYLPDNTRG